MSRARVQLFAASSAALWALWALSTLSACAPEGVDIAQLELGLSAVPPEVTSVTVVVRRGDEVVASATVAPERRTIALGVPAEVPLDIVVLARTARPGPSGVGRMPAYVGRLARSIPLLADATRVAITLRPAGVLTVIVPPSEEVPRTPVGFESIDGGERGPSVRLRAAGFTQSYVVQAGAYRPRFVLDEEDEPPPYTLDATGRIYVEREQETVHVATVTRQPELEPEDPVSLVLGVSRARVQVGEPLVVTVTASSALGVVPAQPGIRVSWRLDLLPTPGALVTDAGEAMGERVGLPQVLSLRARAPTRAWLVLAATLLDGRVLRASLPLEVTDGQPPGPPAALVVRPVDVTTRRTGTALWLDVVDARGAYARTSSITVDLSASDPYVDLGGPPLARAREGRLARTIAVASGPRGRSLTLEVTATATTSGFVATATVVLPAIDVP
jgi:hypothetical protein